VFGQHYPEKRYVLYSQKYGNGNVIPKALFSSLNQLFYALIEITAGGCFVVR
jgi:hypothetical protein